MNQSSTGKIPITQVVAEAYKFFTANGGKLAPAAAVCAAIAAGATTLLQGSGSALSVGAVMLAGLISTLAGLAFAAAVLRLAVRGEFQAPMGLGFGQDEFRLLGVAAGLMLVFAPPVALALLVFSFVIVGRMQLTPEEMQAHSNDPEAMQRAMEQALGPGGMAAMTVAIFAGLLLLLWVGARLFMVQSATIGERRMVAFQTWGWSRGNVGRVILSILMALIPPMLVVTIIGNMLWAVAGQAPSMPLYLGLLAITTFLDLLAQIPAIALGAILYKGLRPPGFVPK